MWSRCIQKYKRVILLLFVAFMLMAILYKYVYKQTRIENLTDRKNIEIVVSRYNESLEWLNDEPFVKYPVICYNKGVNDHYSAQIYDATNRANASVSEAERKQHLDRAKALRAEHRQMIDEANHAVY